MQTQHRRLARLALFALALAGWPAAAQAQNAELPTVAIDPPGGTYMVGDTVNIFIEYEDAGGLNLSSAEWRQNGTSVASRFTAPAGGIYTPISGGSIVLVAGTNTFTAKICDVHNACTTGTAVYTALVPGVAVRPDTTLPPVPASSQQVARFRVRNTGSATQPINVTPACTGVTGCAVSGPITVAPGDSGYVDVSFQAPASGSGQVKLHAFQGQAKDSAWIAVTTLAAAGDPGYPGDAQSLMRIERGMCLTVSLGHNGAYECGDLRLAHGLPATRVLNTVRAPVLLYNSQHAQPAPIVAVHVAPAAGTRPDTVRATLTITGNGIGGSGIVVPGKWAGWPSDTTKRVAVSWEVGTYPTGVYDYHFEVQGTFNAGGSPQTMHSRYGRLIVVNRATSPYGAGWWVSGVEQLVNVSDTLKLWVGGDGSARLYHGTSSAGPWAADAFDRPDTLKKQGTEYYRTLPGQVQVWYDANGRHVRTVNRMGHQSRFVYAGATERVDSLYLPRGTVFNSGLAYTFEYNTTSSGHPVLSRVASPWTSGSRYTWVTSDAGGRVTRIMDPDSTAVDYAYVMSTSRRIGTRTDRVGGRQLYAYTGSKLQTTRVIASASDTARTTYGPTESLGIATALPVTSVYTWVDGPRSDTPNDFSSFVLDRWGAPVRVQNALSQVTTVTRGDVRWPALATKTVAPNGMTVTASYDERGNLSSSTAWDPYGDGRNATTTYRWDAAWDDVTRVTSPTGEIALVAYDSVGRREWQQAGPNASRRATFRYYPTSSATAPGLVRAVVSPAVGSPAVAAVDSVEYDARGNVSATVSPLGTRAEIVSDGIGRMVKTLTPVSGTLVLRDSSVYDINDQVLHQTVTAPALNGVPQQSLEVANTYDAEGNLLSVSRWSVPDTAGIGPVTTRFTYDLAGRQIEEIAPDTTPGDTTDNPRTRTWYDKAGNPVRVRTRRFAELQAAATGSDSAYITIRYDALGRVVERITPPVVYGPRTQGIAAGDYINLLKQKAYPWYPNNGAFGYRIPGDTARFTYNNQGLVTRADNHDAWVRRSYYPNGALRGDTLKTRTLAELSAGGDSTSHVYGLEHAYDLSGRRVELKHPTWLAPRAGGVTQDRTRFAYDPAIGVLSRVTDPLGNPFSFHYDATGQQDSLYLPGGITQGYRYDAAGQVTKHTTANGSTAALKYPGAWLRDETFEYDLRGKMTSGENAYGLLDTTTVTYSGMGHLVESNHVYRGINLYTNQTVRYEDVEQPRHDALGNIATLSRSSSFRQFRRTLLDPGIQNSSYGTTVWGYETGTGRLLLRVTTSDVDSTHYDASGNVVFTNQTPAIEGTAFDRASFYDADERLRLAESRRITNYGLRQPPFFVVFEEYRYDALGRRIWVQTRKKCDLQNEQVNYGPCGVGMVRRTVWDGSAELYDIQRPVSADHYNPGVYFIAAEMESDTAGVRNLGMWDAFDPNPMYGRVAYTYGHAIDRPLSVVRMGYADADSGASFHRWDDFAIVPHWNMRGAAETGTFADGAQFKCMTVGGNPRCVYLNWQEGYFPYSPAPPMPENWHGTLLTEKRDGSGLLYRRNRYYDPSSSRFTQEDPIGLAGGLNAYGFAEGDPVTYNDPYGLFGCETDPDPRMCESLGYQLLIRLGVSDRRARTIMGPAVRAGEIMPAGLGMTVIASGIAIGRTPRGGIRTARSTFTFNKKIGDAMQRRGWTVESVDDVIASPARTRATRDVRHRRGGGGREDAPATAFFDRDGHYVVRNDRTQQIVQISDRNDPGWITILPEP